MAEGACFVCHNLVANSIYDSIDLIRSGDLTSHIAKRNAASEIKQLAFRLNSQQLAKVAQRVHRLLSTGAPACVKANAIDDLEAVANHLFKAYI